MCTWRYTIGVGDKSHQILLFYPFWPLSPLFFVNFHALQFMGNKLYSVNSNRPTYNRGCLINTLLRIKLVNEKISSIILKS